MHYFRKSTLSFDLCLDYTAVFANKFISCLLADGLSAIFFLAWPQTGKLFHLSLLSSESLPYRISLTSREGIRFWWGVYMCAWKVRSIIIYKIARLLVADRKRLNIWWYCYQLAILSQELLRFKMPIWYIHLSFRHTFHFFLFFTKYIQWMMFLLHVHFSHLLMTEKLFLSRSQVLLSAILNPSKIFLHLLLKLLWSREIGWPLGLHFRWGHLFLHQLILGRHHSFMGGNSQLRLFLLQLLFSEIFCEVLSIHF